MNLNDALRQVAEYLELDGDELIAYAAEDTLPGSKNSGDEPNPGRDPNAIPYTDDGKFLYALVRALKPLSCLEVGCNQGGSAGHIALALEANGEGELVTVDISEFSSLKGVPESVLSRVRLLTGFDVGEWHHFGVPPEVMTYAPFEFIHEDSSHEVHTVRAVYERLPALMFDGGVILSHDTALGVGQAILDGIGSGGQTAGLLVEYSGSPCGFAVTRYEGVKV